MLYLKCPHRSWCSNAHLDACAPIREPGMLPKIRPSVKTAPSLLKIFPWKSSCVITKTLMHPCPDLQVRTCPTPGASPVLWRWHVRAERLGEHSPAHLCPLQPGESLCPVTDPCWPPAATEMSPAGVGSSQNHGLAWKRTGRLSSSNPLPLHLVAPIPVQPSLEHSRDGPFTTSPGPHHPLWEEFFPNIWSKPAVFQFEAFPLHPITILFYMRWSASGFKKWS